MFRLTVFVEQNIGAARGTLLKVMKNRNPTWAFHEEPVEKLEWEELPRSVLQRFPKVLL